MRSLSQVCVGALPTFEKRNLKSPVRLLKLHEHKHNVLILIHLNSDKKKKLTEEIVPVKLVLSIIFFPFYIFKVGSTYQIRSISVGLFSYAVAYCTFLSVVAICKKKKIRNNFFFFFFNDLFNLNGLMSS